MASARLDIRRVASRSLYFKKYIYFVLCVASYQTQRRLVVKWH